MGGGFFIGESGLVAGKLVAGRLPIRMGLAERGSAGKLVAGRWLLVS
jgi:hypothetical protein